MRHALHIGCCFVAALLIAPPAHAKKSKAKTGGAGSGVVRIGVTAVVDDQFAPLEDASVTQVLQNAKGTFAAKFGVPDIFFEAPKIVSAKAFFKRLPRDDFRACIARHEPRRVSRIEDYDRPRLQEGVAAFLSRWRLPALLPAFPPDLRATLKTHDDAARALIAEMREAALRATSARFENGEPVLRAKLAEEQNLGRRFVDWLCAFEVQSEADVVLTNAYVFYDLLTEPYPHAVYHGSRLAGAVMQSPGRTLFLGRAVFVSSFGLSGEPETLLEPSHQTLNADDRNKFVGTYLLAHELGHALLRIPDVYDHGPKCLMSTDYALGYVDGYKRLLGHQGRCSRCTIYTDARRALQLFDDALKAKKLKNAEKLAERVVRRMPPNIDGSVGDFAARIYTRLGQAEVEQRKWRAAELYLRRALAADPLHTEARVLLRRVHQQLNAPASR
ncbi:MAG: hypothetical protein IT381_25525 [Deltaproteobacteria bacterium]|nr:hypothetical protein [Deltaproteobacteria bacterium]